MKILYAIEDGANVILCERQDKTCAYHVFPSYAVNKPDRRQKTVRLNGTTFALEWLPRKEK